MRSTFLFAEGGPASDAVTDTNEDNRKSWEARRHTVSENGALETQVSGLGPLSIHVDVDPRPSRASLKSGMKKRSTYTDGECTDSLQAPPGVERQSRGASFDGQHKRPSVRISLNTGNLAGSMQDLGLRIARASGSLFRSGKKSEGTLQLHAWSKGIMYKAYIARGAHWTCESTP